MSQNKVTKLITSVSIIEINARATRIVYLTKVVKNAQRRRSILTPKKYPAVLTLAVCLHPKYSRLTTEPMKQRVSIIKGVAQTVTVPRAPIKFKHQQQRITCDLVLPCCSGHLTLE